MFITIALVALFWIGMWFATRKLRSFVDGIHAPRDIREEKTLGQRIFMAAFGVLSPVGNPEENLGTIFSVGRKDARTEGTATVFRTTAGWRYGFPVLVPFLIAFVFYLETQTDFAGQTSPLFYAAILAAFVWMMVYIWRFRLSIDGLDMTCTNGLLMSRHFDLDKLTRAETTRDGFTLYFSDGRKIAIPRFIEGHDLLRDFVIGELEANGH